MFIISDVLLIGTVFLNIHATLKMTVNDSRFHYLL